MTFSDDASEHHRIPVHKQILFSIFTAILLIFILEITLRFISIPASKSGSDEALPLWVISNMENSNFIPDRLLFWRVPGNTARLNTNNHSLRGLDFSTQKEQDVYRVITLGDSCTWGFGVKPGEEYPWILQRLLNECTVPRIFEIQNAGIPGFSSLQGLRYFKSELIEYDPDLITIYFGRNDHRKLSEEGGYAPDHDVPVPSTMTYTIKSLLNNSRLYSTLRTVVLKFKGPVQDQKAARGVSGHSGRVYRVEAEEFEGNIRDIIQMARSHKIYPVLITAPVFPESIGNYNEIIRMIAQDLEVELIDAEPVFFEHGGNNWLVDDCHPNTKGHLWLASKLKQIVLQRCCNIKSLI